VHVAERTPIATLADGRALGPHGIPGLSPPFREKGCPGYVAARGVACSGGRVEPLGDSFDRHCDASGCSGISVEQNLISRCRK
jgi:hypothetical protein